MIRRDLRRKLDLAKELMITLELPDYEGSKTAPLGYEGLTVTEFEERCKIVNSLLLEVRKSLKVMINEEYNLRFDKADGIEPYDKR